MRRLSVLVATLFLLGAVAAGSASARRPPPPFPKLPAGSWHAEYNVKIGKQLHTLIIDRGRIVQVSLDQMTLLEPDGTRQVIPLSLETIVQPKRLRLTTASLRRGLVVDAMRIDEGAAVRVRIRNVALLRRLRGAA